MEFLHAFQASTGRSDRVLAAGRHRVIRPAIELPAGLAFSNTAPLLEEERDAGILTLVADAANPFSLHRPGPVAAFPADNHPRDPGEVNCAEVFEERLDGKEPDRRRGVPQVLEAREPVSAVLDAHAPPDVRLLGKRAKIGVRASRPVAPSAW